METKIFRRFIYASSLVFAAPLPLVVALEFKSGDWTNLISGLGFTVCVCVLYWWPIGFFLIQHRGRTWFKLLLGYLLSLPLYFATLAILYPLFGGMFQPFNHGRWLIYLSATPQFYGMVLLLFCLLKWRTARWVFRGCLLVLALGVLAPVYAMITAAFAWPPPSSNRIAIAGARIVDVAEGRVVDGYTVYIKDGRIDAISLEGLYSGWPRIDVHGQYLMPGLIDVHTHLQSPIEVGRGFQFWFFLQSILGDYSPQRRAYLTSGITSVRDLGGSAHRSFQMRAEINHRRMLGPHLFTVGRLVTSPHGHPVSTIWPAAISRDGAILARDTQTLINGLHRNFIDGPPDAVKFIHGTIGRAKEKLGADLMASGIRWADEHHLISIVHAETSQEFQDAIDNGATGVEHAAYLQDVPRLLLRSVARNRPFVDPTFGEFETSMTLSRTPDGEKDRSMQQSYQSVRRLHEAGARLVIGTDAPMVTYGQGFHDELMHFLGAGFRPDEILKFATLNNAAYLGREMEVGRIAVGYRADLILTVDNPFEKLETLRQPTWTMLDGQIVARREK